MTGVWRCPTCSRTVKEPAHLLKPYEAVGHLCPNTQKWSDFVREEAKK